LRPLLPAAAIVIALAIPSAAQEPRQAPLQIQQIRDNLYVLKGGGGHTTVFVTTTGVVVVDAKEAGQGGAILEAIRTITDKPVTTLINTGPDREHVGGNAEFPAAVEIIAQRNAKKRMQKMGVRGRGLPTRTFRRTLTLFSGADQVDLLYFGRGHTDGDTWVFFRAPGVVHVGDLFPGDDLPLLDAKNGGSALEIGRTLDNGYRNIKGATLVVTGHGVEQTWPQLQEYEWFNNRFVNDVWTAREASKSVDDVVRGWSIPAGYETYAPIDADRLKNNVALAFRELHDQEGDSARMPYEYAGLHPGAAPPVPGAASPASPPAPAPANSTP
jgi:cyclase